MHATIEEFILSQATSLPFVEKERKKESNKRSLSLMISIAKRFLSWLDRLTVVHRENRHTKAREGGTTEEEGEDCVLWDRISKAKKGGAILVPHVFLAPTVYLAYR
jgi:hypothetical protein